MFELLAVVRRQRSLLSCTCRASQSSVSEGAAINLTELVRLRQPVRVRLRSLRGPLCPSVKRSVLRNQCGECAQPYVLGLQLFLQSSLPLMQSAKAIDLVLIFSADLDFLLSGRGFILFRELCHQSDQNCIRYLSAYHAPLQHLVASLLTKKAKSKDNCSEVQHVTLLGSNFLLLMSSLTVIWYHADSGRSYCPKDDKIVAPQDFDQLAGAIIEAQ